MVNVAVVGCGHWGGDHIRVIKELEEEGSCRLHGVCDIRKDVARYHSRKYEVRCYFDYRDVADDVEIDAVSVVTPNSTHYEIAERFLRAGKDFFWRSQ